MNERIKELRVALELSQEKFGARLGVTKTAISRLENGGRNVTEQMLRAICQEYGTGYIWLTTGVGSMFEDSSDDVALNVMIDRVMASENDRVKSIFKGLGNFTTEDWEQVDQLLDKLLAGQRPWSDPEAVPENKKEDMHGPVPCQVLRSAFACVQVHNVPIDQG